MVALIVAGLETLKLIGGQLGLTDGGGFWGAIGSLNDNFGLIGAVIVGVSAAAWAVSHVVYRVNRYDEIEVSAG
jgi:high-affinity nickel-transport protein